MTVPERPHSYARRPVLIAVMAAAIAEVVADVGFAVARDSLLIAGYFALSALIVVVLALAVTALAWLSKLPPHGALAVYSGVAALAVQGIASGATYLLVAAVVLTLRARTLGRIDTTRDAVTLGSGVGLALGVALIFWPRVLVGKDIFPSAASAEAIGGGIVFGSTMLAVLVWGRARQIWSRMPSELIVVASSLVLLFMILPSGIGSRRADLPAEGGVEAREKRPHVLVLILDTVRADHLSVYGYPRDTTPMLEKWAAQDGRVVVYPMAFSPSSWTVPSHASLFSGLPVSRHGVYRHDGAEASAFYFGVLPSSDTLAEAMAAAGYRTAGIYANRNLQRIGGGERGFEVVYRPRVGRPLQLTAEALRSRLVPQLAAASIKPYPDAEQINDGILRFFDQCLPAPCFVVANYMDAHVPLHPRPPHRGRFDGGPLPPGARWDGELREMVDDYDECIRGLDERVSELLSALERRGVLDDSWIFITSDHGEAFDEHAVTGHGTSVYNEQVRIPLIVHPARGVRLSRRDDAVGLLDIAATASAIAGQPPVGAGRDLRDRAAAEAPQAIELYASEEGERRAVVYGGKKLIEFEEGRSELYDMLEDPGERNDLIASDEAIAASLTRLLLEPSPVGPSGKTETEDPGLSVDDKQALRALGYID